MSNDVSELKFVESSKTQESKYLENETLPLYQKKSLYFKGHNTDHEISTQVFELAF